MRICKKVPVCGKRGFPFGVLEIYTKLIAIIDPARYGWGSVNDDSIASEVGKQARFCERANDECHL